MESVPPPVPPRHYASSTNSQLGSIHPQLIGSNLLQPYGLYNGYGINPMYMNSPYGACNNNSGFVRFAEESSRGAFQSIEKVVNAFVSISTMLTSTHQALFSTFKAVVGVVEQFRSLKEHIISVFIGSVLRWLRFIWRTILSVLRMKPRNYADSEETWADIIDGRFANDSTKPKSFNFTSLIFWIIALGGPYLILKYVSKIVEKEEESRKWASGETDHYIAQGLYNFTAGNNYELSISSNELLRIAPKSEQPSVREWILASSMDGQRIGLVPINHIKLISRTPPPCSTITK